MDKLVVMPKMGMTMEYGTISEVFVKPGDMVNEGDPLMEFETNKMTETIDAPCAGQVMAVRNVEEEVPVGEPVCHIKY